MMKYIVKLNYETFEFDNFEDAGIFATSARKHWKNHHDYADTLDVSIEVLGEDESKEPIEVPMAE